MGLRDLTGGDCTTNVELTNVPSLAPGQTRGPAVPTESNNCLSTPTPIAVT